MAVEEVSALVNSPPVEGWQAKPDEVVVLCLHGVNYMCRGKIEPPIEPVGQSAFLLSAPTRYTCTIYTFIHQIYANHNLVAQAVGFMQ